MIATDAANATLKARNVNLNRLPDGMQHIFNAIKVAALDGYYATSMHMNPVQRIALGMLGYELDGTGPFKIIWGKE